jgi:hypothetical protein
MRRFGKYVSTRYTSSYSNGDDGTAIIAILMLFLICFSVMNPTFFLFWIPLFIAYPIVKKSLYKKDKVKKDRDYE